MLITQARNCVPAQHMRVQCELCREGRVLCGDGVYEHAGVYFVRGLGAGRIFMDVFVFWQGCQKSRSGVWYGCHLGGY